MISIVFALISLVGIADAADYCVSKQGSDAASGAYPKNCWKTAARAASKVAPGDTVCFQAGQYSGMTLSRSGKASDPITWKRCKGVAQGEVRLDASGNGFAAIAGKGGVTDQVINGIDFDASLYGSGKKGLYQWGGNDRWEISNMRFMGPERSGSELWNTANGQGADGTNNRDKLWRLNGDDIWFHHNYARYWPFQILGEGDIMYRLLAEHNDLAYASSHIVSIDGNCNYGYPRTGNVYQYNYLGQSYTSDTWQINEDQRKNPDPTGAPNGTEAACKGGYRIIKNILYASGENGVDIKGLANSVIEGNLIVGFTGDSGGPVNGPNYGCGGGVVTGSGAFSKDILVRNNVFADNASGWGNAMDGSGAYNNTWLHNKRSAIGIDAGKCGATAWRNTYGEGTYWLNNVVADDGVMVWVGATKDVAIDGNLYAPGVRWGMYGGSSNQKASTLESWRKILSNYSSLSGGEKNSSANGLADRVFSTAGMAEYTLGHPFTRIGLDSVLADARKFKLRSSYEDGGQSIARVEKASTGRIINVGARASAFCCGWDMPVSAPPKDSIRIGDQTRTITDVNVGAGTITVNSPIIVSKGQGIDIVYASGRTSRQRGAHEYWTGAGKSIVVKKLNPVTGLSLMVD